MDLKKPFTILVVDDEPPIYDLLTRVAQKQFQEAQFVNLRSAGETLEYLNDRLNKWPSLVLLDIDLHQAIDGLEFLPQLRDRLERKVPIIMFTSSVNEPNVEEAYEKGAAAFTQKPNSLQEWRDYVTRLKDYWYDTNLSPSPPKSTE